MSPATPEDLVSVIIPCFNCEDFVSKTLRSVFQQTHLNWEIIAVLDPKANLETRQKVEEVLFGHPQAHIIHANQPGVAAARNAGLDRATGNYICFLDADDVWLPDKLKVQLSALKMRKTGFCATGFRRMDRDGRRLGRVHRMPRKITYRRLLKQNCICISSVMLERRQISQFRFQEIGCEDFAYWLEILKTGQTCLGLHQPLVHYRIHERSRGSSKLKTAKESWTILQNELPEQPLKRSWFFSQLLIRGAVKYFIF